MTRAEQTDFLLALFRPLLTLGETAFLLDECSERHVLNLLDEGKLRGVNIAKSTETRREIRIYRYSVEHRIMVPLLPLTSIEPERIFPHSRPTILRREAALWLACTEQHVSQLALAGPRDSSDVRHRIYRDALVAFLTSRDIA